MSEGMLLALTWVAFGLFGFFIGWVGGVAEGRARERAAMSEGGEP